MKLKILLFIILIGIVSSVAFSSDKKTVNLHLNLAKGDSLRFLEAQENRTTTAMPKGEMRVENKREVEYLLECLAVDPNGFMTIRKTWVRAKETYRSGLGTNINTMLDYDSAREKKENEKNDHLYFSFLIGNSVIVKVQPDGTILSCQGAENFADKLIKKDEAGGSVYSDEKRKKMIDSWTKMFQGLVASLQHYPENPVSIGDKWAGPWGSCAGADGPQKNGPEKYAPLPAGPRSDGSTKPRSSPIPAYCGWR